MQMPHSNPRTATVAFKVEAELAELLNQLPNKSAFIRQAIAAQLGLCCPLCKGKGIVPRAIHDYFARLIDAHRLQNCFGCGESLPLPDPSAELTPADRARLEQFFLGGPLYCDPCYRAARPCDDCGWHIDGEHQGDHRKMAHPGDN